MSWNFKWDLKKGKSYGYYQRNYRKNGKYKSEYVYIGEKKTALKILNDLQKDLSENKRFYTYTGEIILQEIAKRLNFAKIINSMEFPQLKWDIGKFIEVLVIERVLFPLSKWALAVKTHQRSILSLQSSIPTQIFYENNIYHYMDYLHPFLHNIQSELVEHIYQVFPSSNEVLILDGTSLACHQVDSDPDIDDDFTITSELSPEDQCDLFDQHVSGRVIARMFGYSRDKRPDLPQINLMLGVNQKQIPLYFEVYSGNTIDLQMFQQTLLRLKKDYSNLFKRMKERYLIFDRGNLSPANEQWLTVLCKEWNCYFIGGLLSSLVKDELCLIDSEKLPIIYERNDTILHGKIIVKQVYSQEYTVLLYVSQAVRSKKLEKFEQRLQSILKTFEQILEDSRLADHEKITVMKEVLREHSMVQLFRLKRFDKNGNPIRDPKWIPSGKLWILREDKVEKRKLRIRAKGQSLKHFEQKLLTVLKELKRLSTNEALSPYEKVEEMKIHLKKYSMITLFNLKRFTSDGNEIPEDDIMDSLYQLLDQKVEERKQLFGKFAVMTNDSRLSAKEIMQFYKTKEKVEHEFHLLKTLLKIRPINHRLSRRMETHNAIVHWGMIFLSVLKNILETNGLSYTFEELLDILRRGVVQKVVFSYPEFKTLEKTSLHDFTQKGAEIFRILKLKPQPFWIEELHRKVLPPIFEKKKSKNGNK